MSRRIVHILAALFAMAALTQDWWTGELFFHMDSPLNVALALLLNGVAILGVYGIAALVRREALGLAWLRFFSLAALFVVLAGAFPRSHILIIAAAIMAAVLAIGLKGEWANRAVNAALAASIAFLLTPLIWRAMDAQQWVWLRPAVPSSSRPAGNGAVVALLLDELGFEASQPIADDLRRLGLVVHHTPMTSAGPNTQNVVPALFTKQDFTQARQCGVTSQCSGRNRLDYAKIKAGRPDIDVAGLFLPYCDIIGLRTCYAVPMPREFRNAYFSLADGYLHHVGLRLPKALQPTPDTHERAQQLKNELAAIDAMPVWDKGGVLYAHFPLPHPPGANGAKGLDQDYADNIELARPIVIQLAQRLQQRFGRQFTLIIFSDHGLRDYWRETSYPGERGRIRSEFQDKRVPLIVAKSDASPVPALQSNADIFDLLSAEASRVTP